jgi:NADPH-dependent 2,4-dienoyl-CoA reductase/sulfur reductase-like enzyme
MRGGGKISCLVNPTTGRELEFAETDPPKGERIAVVGAGPAGLSYAYHAAEWNEVTVFERAAGPGGAFVLAGKAVRFQEVEAREAPLRAFVDELERGCRQMGAVFRYATDVVLSPEVLAPFDRIVVATGARYRYGLGLLVPGLLGAGLGRRGPLRYIFDAKTVRDWFYTRGRRGRGGRVAGVARPDQKVQVIGDAAAAGKAKEAIGDAVRAACFDPIVERHPVSARRARPTAQ